MDVILLEKVENLGGLGDKVSVKSGFARNYLLPTGKATSATKENIAVFEERRKELEGKAADSLSNAQVRAEKLSEMSIVIPVKAGDEGKLFGSVGTTDIAAYVTEAGVQIEKKEVKLPAGPLRVVGDYDVDIHLHADVKTQVKISIVAD